MLSSHDAIPESTVRLRKILEKILNERLKKYPLSFQPTSHEKNVMLDILAEELPKRDHRPNLNLHPDYLAEMVEALLFMQIFQNKLIRVNSANYSPDFCNFLEQPVSALTPDLFSTLRQKILESLDHLKKDTPECELFVEKVQENFKLEMQNPTTTKNINEIFIDTLLKTLNSKPSPFAPKKIESPEEKAEKEDKLQQTTRPMLVVITPGEIKPALVTASSRPSRLIAGQNPQSEGLTATHTKIYSGETPSEILEEKVELDEMEELHGALKAIVREDKMRPKPFT